MEALLHQFPVPPPQPLPQDALLQQAVAARALMMAAGGNMAPSTATTAAGAGREQCPRCASRDTKFCYYNNYNTAQPRHFCRACRRYWTLGGSLRNVPVGGPFAASPATLLQGTGGGGLLLSSLLLGSVSASAASALASPLLALGTAPLLEGRLVFDLGLGDAALADLAHHQQLSLGAGPLPWPAATTVLEGDRAETTTWKAASSVFPYPPAAALWQELAAAAPVVEAGGLHLHHGGAPHLLL
ncbi:unnamed protein product [Miscanthus lutarioriparius]|uniref:Dof zinc finger protein n=1 Tax=Miscanthus lutarioriparius TaxID=422564 RepID=A0A811RHY5_9POAL|nr:unnamed protein product [Miscanthus lutarioriparius]